MARFNLKEMLAETNAGWIFVYDPDRREDHHNFVLSLQKIIGRWCQQRSIEATPTEVLDVIGDIWVRLQTLNRVFGSVNAFVAYLRDTAIGQVKKHRIPHRRDSVRPIPNFVLDIHPDSRPNVRLERAERDQELRSAVLRLKPSHQDAIRQFLSDSPIQRAGYAMRYRAFRSLERELRNTSTPFDGETT